MKRLIFLKLKILAKLVLKKYRPIVIGITGSVGKTSTKEAIYTVLQTKKRVRQSIKNYNNELGVPLTIFDAEAPGKNIFSWISLGLKASKLILFRDKDYPEVLILELGIDRPGDMDYLLSIAKPDIAVATTVGTVHLEYFRDKRELQSEKAKLIKAVGKDGWAIVNNDEEATKKMINNVSSRTLSYGFDEGADLQATNISLSYGGEFNHLQGLSYKLAYKESYVPVHLPNALGAGMIYSSLAATAVGIAFGMNLHEVSEALKAYKSPKGRLNVVPGIKYTTIIDDSYNAEPKSTMLALNTFNNINIKQGARKLVALGDMLELGEKSVELHREIGEMVKQIGADKLYTVGERARDIARSARDAGMREEDVFMFDSSIEAGKFIQKRIKQGDYLLVKGSQGMRMEKIVLELMAEPLRAEELLVRMDESWRDR